MTFIIVKGIGENLHPAILHVLKARREMVKMWRVQNEREVRDVEMYVADLFVEDLCRLAKLRQVRRVSIADPARPEFGYENSLGAMELHIYQRESGL